MRFPHVSPDGVVGAFSRSRTRGRARVLVDACVLARVALLHFQEQGRFHVGLDNPPLSGDRLDSHLDMLFQIEVSVELAVRSHARGRADARAPAQTRSSSRALIFYIPE